MCCTEETIDLVWPNYQVLSPEDTPQTHETGREISREKGIRLRCYEITTMLFVAAFYWHTV